ncbi:sterol desaturase family protein [Parapedobacter indicus]|uniref:Sterol desaturase/sphingolipid hydroxylase, fatty acid hydroxylase superfamily n=1 Tax=Parapedobacter indicus TaxID=1477437 RepID=A0A1I3CNP6_9SPHI|nr:sterol desaturase family protein [Parapedobacter indicus]PPL04333.1 sterol desaturase/sphingolipid hydroxylase (fatty acid hydroxylase superfamily) [Parapedobacter indicus]SFH76200.1 Sterol desaturase/sphingolipid hydroxylase, fatty acid hydroxylase superfamily [Parapedobacter indicus]
MIRSIFDVYGAPVLVIFFVLLFFLESNYQLRKRVQGRWKRIIINFIVSIPAFLLLRLMLIPAMVWLAVKNQSWHIGLNQLFDAAPLIEGAIAFLLLDYSNYLWHILLHKLPVLWRFHLVHHCDLDLDITTAFRFHFGELVGSVLFRGAAVVLIGASPVAVLIYEIAFEAATQFHHSNLKMPFRLEKTLNFLVVTPRMHGIHHSVVKRETDSNYAIVFSVWDRIHRTVRLNVPQNRIITGVPSYADESELTIGRLFKLPFTKIRPWPSVGHGASGDEKKENRNQLEK